MSLSIPRDVFCVTVHSADVDVFFITIFRVHVCVCAYVRFQKKKKNELTVKNTVRNIFQSNKIN